MTAPRVALSPVHLVRAGEGREAVRLTARGFGLVLGSLGVVRVRAAVDEIRLVRPRGRSLFAVFFGLHGVSFTRANLPPVSPVASAAVRELLTPAIPAPVPTPSLELRLTITPPELP